MLTRVRQVSSRMPRVEQCETLIILMARMHSDLEVYCDAVARLGQRDGTPFETIYERSEQARKALENARVRLNEHIAEHGCMA